MNEKWLTVAEVAETLRVSGMTILRMIKGGALGAQRVGRQWRIAESTVNRKMEVQSSE